MKQVIREKMLWLTHHDNKSHTELDLVFLEPSKVYYNCSVTNKEPYCNNFIAFQTDFFARSKVKVCRRVSLNTSGWATFLLRMSRIKTTPTGTSVVISMSALQLEGSLRSEMSDLVRLQLALRFLLASPRRTVKVKTLLTIWRAIMERNISPTVSLLC